MQTTDKAPYYTIESSPGGENKAASCVIRFKDSSHTVYYRIPKTDKGYILPDISNLTKTVQDAIQQSEHKARDIAMDIVSELDEIVKELNKTESELEQPFRNRLTLRKLFRFESYQVEEDLDVMAEFELHRAYFGKPDYINVRLKSYLVEKYDYSPIPADDVPEVEATFDYYPTEVDTQEINLRRQFLGWFSAILSDLVEISWKRAGEDIKQINVTQCMDAAIDDNWLEQVILPLIDPEKNDGV